MEEVRWVSRKDVLAAVAASAAPDNPYYGAPSGALTGPIMLYGSGRCINRLACMP